MSANRNDLRKRGFINRNRLTQELINYTRFDLLVLRLFAVAELKELNQKYQN